MPRALAAGILAAAAIVTAHAADTIPVAPFSTLAAGGSLPPDWKELVPSGRHPRTDYRLVENAGITVLKAQASASASAMSRPIRVDPRAFPMLRWRWNVANLVERGDPRHKNSDDYPARLYVFFDYDVSRLPVAQRMKLAAARAIHGDGMPLAALCYVWDARTPAGTILPNAFTDRVRMVVVEAGPARLGRWIEFERNVLADFKTAFGEDAPEISGIAVAVDTDNTGERATTLFGDVTLLRAKLVP